MTEGENGMLFGGQEERERRANLKKLEDKRLVFAQRMDREGFRPEKMLFCSFETGNFAAFCRQGDACVAILSPMLGSDDDFIVTKKTDAPVRVEDVDEKGTALGGAFGVGKKAVRGTDVFVELESGTIRLRLVANSTLLLETEYRKNPLLSLKRRRSDANVTWDLHLASDRALRQYFERMTEDYFA